MFMAGISGIIPGTTATATQPGAIENLFANGEIGDFWVFDNVNTDQATVGNEISAATGLVNGNVLETAINGPTLQQPSGNYVARFNGGGDRLVYSLGSTSAQPGTIILCLSSADTATHVIATGSGLSARWQIGNDSSDNIYMNSGASLDSTINANYGTKVFTAVFDGASSKFRSNGSQVASGNAGTGSTDQFRLGGLWDNTSFAAFDLYCALFIDRILTTDELNYMEPLMGSYAGLTW